MNTDASAEPGRDRAQRLSVHELVQRRVQRILLVSSLYDSFILSEEGRLQETLLSQFIDLNLIHVPDVSRVPSGRAALDRLEQPHDFDLVVSSLNVGEVNAVELKQQIRAMGQFVPVVALAYSGRELADFVHHNPTDELDGIFLWQGDARIFLAIVKFIEDRLNVAHDTGELGVPVILVVEDNIRFHSSFLPAVYSEIFRHMLWLMSEDLNLSQKMLRMKARPKVLLCRSFEEAWSYFTAYEEQILGVISDIQFPRGGKLDPRAGLELTRRVHDARPDVRIVLQSSLPEYRRLAGQVDASFLLKGSPVLLHDLRRILVERFGFGDFVFRLDGREVDRAHDLRTLLEKLETVPAESVAYHAARNHFSNWLKARTEFELADKLRPRKVEDFDDIEALRRLLLDMIGEYRRERNRAIVADFDRRNFDPSTSISRIGQGSLGGKARGLAFANNLLQRARTDRRFPGVEIHVPTSVVLGTQVFDEFLDRSGLAGFALATDSDERIQARFQREPLPAHAVQDLRSFLEKVDFPLAVRSSSLLEDSFAQPFAGVYRTCMLANCHPDLDVRLQQLVRAVKSVYASAFTRGAKTYLDMTQFRLEEEKMAVLIQKVVGQRRGPRFYPDFSGVARSYNFYPQPPYQSEDGVAALALGLGRTVVEGSPCLRFCPRHPRHVLGFSSVQDAINNSQREFYAIDMAPGEAGSELADLRRHGLDVADEDNALTWVGSTWLPEDDRVADGVARPGVRLVSFAQVLKHGIFPLAEVLTEMLDAGSRGTNGPVEIEFAGNLPGPSRDRAEFAFLQLRPLAMFTESDTVQIEEVPEDQVVCRSPTVLGNGRVDDIADIIVVDKARFDRGRSAEVAQQVAEFNAELAAAERPYLLIGVGRWGSSDPHLGIPVSWHQIAGVRAIVEAGFRDFRVEPSQGTHFFQNLTSSNVGYFTVNPDVGEGFVDWEWLAAVPAVRELGCVRWIRLPRPLRVKIDGRQGHGVVLKPAP